VPAQPLRCETYVSLNADVTGEKALECGAIALACSDCEASAGCEEHAVLCPKCGKPVCDYCADEHGCVAAEKKRAA
jgi:hypothetical protein